MKARKKNSNNEWQEITYVQLENSDILYKAQYLEFESDTLSTELKTYEQMGLKSPLQDYWQNVRERAAIAIMQELLANSTKSGSLDVYAKAAVKYADAFVEQLKKNK